MRNSRRSNNRNYPRTRGEYTCSLTAIGLSSGLPPHTRGILLDGYNVLNRRGITPAYAGNTYCRYVPPLPRRDYPRTCGEYCLIPPDCCGSMGSPPHTRGIPNVGAFSKIKLGITPAHAGNTGYQRTPAHLGWDHPRTRGEYDWLILKPVPREGSPPHTRGIH